MTFTTHHLEFTATVLTPLALEAQPGSSLRGALMGALWARFCANKTAQTCAACPLLQVCPVAQLIAPMRDVGETGGEQRPRPYVTRPPLGRAYAPGETLSFGLALFGGPTQLFPYVVMAAQALAVYELMLEETWRLPVRRGFFYSIPLRQAVPVPFTPALRRKAERHARTSTLWCSMNTCRRRPPRAARASAANFAAFVMMSFDRQRQRKDERRKPASSAFGFRLSSHQIDRHPRHQLSQRR